MMKGRTYALALAILLGATLLGGRAQAQQSVVRAVLFYSPTCSHCHYVITEVLPPLAEQYGAQLQIVGIDISNPAGQALYQGAIEHFNIADAQRGVPTLIVGTTVLVGSSEIPAQFPGIIAQSLTAGGVQWPEIPGLTEALATSEPTPPSTLTASAEQTSAPTTGAPASALSQSEPEPATLTNDVLEQPKANLIAPNAAAVLGSVPLTETLMSKLGRDPVGNTLAVLLLLGMLAVLVFAVIRIVRAWAGGVRVLALSQAAGWRHWAILGVGLIGLGVSIYMAFIETTRTAAICGPVGDCNTVQQSEYAMLFGWLPIGVLGVLGYGAILMAWAGQQWGGENLRRVAATALLGMVLFGIMFSIYLTFLEPFVIGATCVWCLTSALCMTLILVVLAGSMPNQTPPAQSMA